MRARRLALARSREVTSALVIGHDLPPRDVMSWAEDADVENEAPEERESERYRSVSCARSRPRRLAPAIARARAHLAMCSVLSNLKKIQISPFLVTIVSSSHHP